MKLFEPLAAELLGRAAVEGDEVALQQALLEVYEWPDRHRWVGTALALPMAVINRRCWRRVQPQVGIERKGCAWGPLSASTTIAEFYE